MRLAVFLISFLLLFSVGVCQSLTRQVKGMVHDQHDNPLRGAVVQIENKWTLEIRSYVTPRSGKYHFAGVNTFNDYELRASYRGQWSETKYLSRLNTRDPAIIDLIVKAPD